MSFPINLHLRLRWRYISRLQFRARGPVFHAELIPVHSPLLRESYLVSYPPLTYMLKFSGFANLTSCLESSALKPKQRSAKQQQRLTQPKVHHCPVSWQSKRSLVHQMPQERRHAHLEARAIATACPVKDYSRWNNKAQTLKKACFRGYPKSTICVQVPVGSRNPAIHNAYRTSLRPSSLFEPRHPSLKVVSSNGSRHKREII